MRKKLKLSMLVLVLLLAVGFAAVSTTLVINGTANFGTNEEEFDVYYSNALVNGEQDLSVITDNQTITFTESLTTLGDKYILDYDVTNGSKNYDAKLEMTCTESNDYLTVTNNFDIETILEASKTRSGKLTIELKKSYAGSEELSVEITCTINARAAERTEASTEEPALDAESQKIIGTEITIAKEKFNVISDNGDTITMLAQYNLGTDYRQSKANTSISGLYCNHVSFSHVGGWEYTPGPKEIDLNSDIVEAIVKTYINEYVTYLQGETGDTTLSGNLITLTELKSLGCTIQDDYSYTGNETCANSKYISWLSNGGSTWTRSAVSNEANHVWVLGVINLEKDPLHAGEGIRPIITISKDVL